REGSLPEMQTTALIRKIQRELSVTMTSRSAPLDALRYSIVLHTFIFQTRNPTENRRTRDENHLQLNNLRNGCRIALAKLGFESSPLVLVVSFVWLAPFFKGALLFGFPSP